MACILTEIRVFMQQQSGIPFRWGQSDCLLFCAEWIKQRTGIDVGTCFRGTYATEQEAQALIVRHGGFAALAEAAFERAGAQCPRLERRQLEAGAVGIVADPDTWQMRGGVCTGRGWIMKSPEGVFADQTGRLLIVRAWRCLPQHQH